MRRGSFILLVALGLQTGWAEERGDLYRPPHYNFSSYRVLVRADVLAAGATVVVFGGDEPYVNGFFAPSCVMTLDGRTVELHDVIFLNLDLVLKSGRHPDQVLLHELTHFWQYRRCPTQESYFAEWRRQQALNYWERPWEREAHNAENRDSDLIRIIGRQMGAPVAIRFDADEGGLASRTGAGTAEQRF